ncbi:MAG: hypothetical protein GX872_02490 [Firmicutes bacterium]|nr:hypothetical protein [Bacillota bacterium]
MEVFWAMVSFIDEFEDLILRDMQKEGYEAEEEELCGSTSIRTERAIRHTEE